MKKLIAGLSTVFVIISCLLIFTACREPLTTKINFIVNGTVYHYSWTNGKSLELPDEPEKIGHDFAGWFWDESFNDSYDVFDLLKIKDHTEYNLYAKWQKSVYELSFDAKNGSSITVTDITYESNYKLPSVPPERAGFVFEGWYTQPNGAGEEITNGSVCTKTSAHTLYAKWNPKTYNVVYVDYFGNEIVRPTTFGDNYRIDLVYQTDVDTIEYLYKLLPGYEFKGWYTQPNGNGTRLNYNSILTTASDHKIYAYYQKVDNGITFLPFKKSFYNPIFEYNAKYGYTIICQNEYESGISVYDKNFNVLYTLNAGYVKAIDTEGDYLIYVSDFAIKIIDIKTGSIIKTISGNNCNGAILDGDILIYQYSDTYLCFYNLANEETTLSENYYSFSNNIEAFAINKKDDLVYLIFLDSISSKVKLVCFNYSTGKKIFEQSMYGSPSFYQPFYFDGTDLNLEMYTYDGTTGEQKTIDISEYETNLNYTENKILVNNDNHLIVRYYEHILNEKELVFRIAIRIYDKKTKSLIKEAFGSYNMQMAFSDETVILYDGEYLAYIPLETA